MNAAALPNESRLFRVTEVARHLSLSRSKVYSMMEAGALEYVKFGKSRRVPQSAIERLLKESRVGA